MEFVFGLESPDTEKWLNRLESEIFTKDPTQDKVEHTNIKFYRVFTRFEGFWSEQKQKQKSNSFFLL